MKFSGWFGFWLFMCVLVVTDCHMMSKGIDGYLYQFKTPTEKVIQQEILNCTKEKPTS